MIRERAVFAMQTNGPVPIESRALGTLSYIRASMDAASSLAVPGLAGILMGSIGVTAAALASVPALRGWWLEIWLVAAVVAFVLGAALVARQASQRGGVLISTPIRKLVLCLCPALLGGGVLTLVFWQADLQRLIPGMWLLLYGCAVISASTVINAMSLRLVASMGALFAALGIAAFALPPATHTFILAGGFGALHLIFGILIGRQNRGE